LFLISCSMRPCISLTGSHTCDPQKALL
jgi:hypothetical protein